MYIGIGTVVLIIIIVLVVLMLRRLCAGFSRRRGRPPLAITTGPASATPRFVRN